MQPAKTDLARQTESMANRLARVLAYNLAYIGGLSLIFLVLMTGVSVSGRALTDLGLRPIPGDFELVEVGTALAVFFFLPLAHFAKAHARVDLFAPVLPSGFKVWIDRLADLMLFALMIFIAARLFVGTIDKHFNQETTFILQFPLWWPYAASTCLAALGALVSGLLTYDRWNSIESVS